MYPRLYFLGLSCLYIRYNVPDCIPCVQKLWSRLTQKLHYKNIIIQHFLQKLSLHAPDFNIPLKYHSIRVASMWDRFWGCLFLSYTTIFIAHVLAKIIIIQSNNQSCIQYLTCPQWEAWLVNQLLSFLKSYIWLSFFFFFTNCFVIGETVSFHVGAFKSKLYSMFVFCFSLLKATRLPVIAIYYWHWSIAVPFGNPLIPLFVLINIYI